MKKVRIKRRKASQTAYMGKEKIEQRETDGRTREERENYAPSFAPKRKMRGVGMQ